nr:basic salivary proline-rich protein 1 [Oryctolagus cuniculus]
MMRPLGRLFRPERVRASALGPGCAPGPPRGPPRSAPARPQTPPPPPPGRAGAWRPGAWRGCVARTPPRPGRGRRGPPDPGCAVVGARPPGLCLPELPPCSYVDSSRWLKLPVCALGTEPGFGQGLGSLIYKRQCGQIKRDAWVTTTGTMGTSDGHIGQPYGNWM